MALGMRTIVMAALMALGCGDDGRALPGGRDASLPPGTDGAVPTLDARVPPGTDAAVTDGAAPDGGSTPAIDFCQLSCAVAADCGTGSGAFDGDNYACEAGVCRYLGCRTDGECADSFRDSSYVCRDAGGLDTCQQGCASAADCATASAAFDTDNYACEAGVCRYLGCNSDAECTATFRDDRYGCREAAPPDSGLPVPTAARNCVLTCGSATDCTMASAAFDGDNYACEAGTCRYRGCNDDAECAASFSDARYVCR